MYTVILSYTSPDILVISQIYLLIKAPNLSLFADICVVRKRKGIPVLVSISRQ